MNLVFTICSVNYLAQAHTLGESLRTQNPDYQYVIGLVDKLETKNIDASKLPPFQLLEIDKINIPDFEKMCSRYDITELNTAVKPFFINYFLKNFPHANNIIYLDPDIIVFDKLTHLEENLEKYNIVLTPHITTSYNDNKWQSEEDVVNTGVFNLGFIAMRRGAETQKMVDWWCKKLEKECVIDLCKGLFVDQHWAEFMPVFFDKVLITKHLGYNVAYWNLHERIVSLNEDRWFVNETIPLQFFHYSGYLINKPTIVSKYQNRISFSNRSDISGIFELYKNKLIENHELYLKKFHCDYIKPPKVKRYLRVRKYLKMPFEKLADLLEW
jgi:hypothetical protein